MRRREFITLLAGAITAIRSLAARAAGPAQVGFISGLSPGSASDFLAAFREGLAMHGYSEPGTLRMVTLFAENVPERIPALLEELERRRVDVIVTHAAATESVVKGHRTIPGGL